MVLSVETDQMKDVLANVDTNYRHVRKAFRLKSKYDRLSLCFGQPSNVNPTGKAAGSSR